MTENILRFTLRDAKHRRYEVPIQSTFNLLDSVEMDANRRQYSLDLGTNLTDFQFAITRKSTKTKLFDTSIGGLIYSDQFIQLATNLATDRVYGFGENLHQTLRHNMAYKTWSMFGREPVGIRDNYPHNLYGIQPFYTVLETDGKAHGVLFLNSNVMDYTLLPEPGLALKSGGGILDFFLFMGDNPEHVIQLYTSVIGRTHMPPFWALGYQLCRYGFKNTSHIKQTIDRNLRESIPLDVMYVDIDYMNGFRDFTYDPVAFKGLPELMGNTRQQNSIRWTLVIEPHVEASLKKNYSTFDLGYTDNVFVRWDPTVPVKDRHYPDEDVPLDKGIYYGHQWPDGPVAYVDWFANRTDQWWANQIRQFHSVLPFDGLWTDMNEPVESSGMICPKNKYDYPPFRSDALYAGPQLSVWTICMVCRLGPSTTTTITGQESEEEYLHYDVHNIYGLKQSISTKNAIQSTTGKRGMLLSRNTYVTSGRYAAHWLGDNASKWTHLRNSVIGMLEFNMFGINFVGADICGFNEQTTPELCLRWHQLGAFYPFSRNHNERSNSDQDPAVWADRGHREVTDGARSSLQLRYQLLPHLYTLFYRAHLTGGTVARPMFYEWPLDPITHDIDQQFMWGSSILISPIMYENKTEINGYLPPGDRWYEVRPQFKRVATTGRVVIRDPQSGTPPIHFRGGSIIPMVSDHRLVSTTGQRETFRRLNLIVLPTNSSSGQSAVSNYRATGELFWDDGDSIGTIEQNKYNLYRFELTNCLLNITVLKSGLYQSSTGIPVPIINKIVVVDTDPSGQVLATLNDSPVKASHQSASTEIELNLQLDGQLSKEWTIKWSIASDNDYNTNTTGAPKCDIL
ncbi:sucrase-isomaltase, intestinal-like [Oppia nitens]|uniref:sucrase-isomaltase, intestinal-like n=1 Tax=Oppia nitens TaxID=1686743 RepID=UPI0023DA47DD|nr:sucrase-isomaltase, intestinal-like [Oppia nitens]